MINREESIKYSRNLVSRSKSRRVDPQYSGNNCDDREDSEQYSEEDYPETETGKVGCCHSATDMHGNVLFYFIPL